MATVAAVTAQKAGFWIRFVAYLIDVVIVYVVEWIVAQVLFAGNPLAAGASAVNLVIALAYFLYFWSSYGGGQTVGMRVLKLRVVKTDGSALDLVGAFLRFVGFIVAAIPILIGLIWVAFDANKQGWHDKIAGTYVVKT